MSTRMHAVEVRRLYAGVGTFLLAGLAGMVSACDNGIVQPLVLLPTTDASSGEASAAGTSPSSGGSGGMTGTAGRHLNSGAGRDGDSYAGASGMVAPRAPDFCDMPQPDKEAALRDALNDAITAGRFCPHNPPGLRQALTVDAGLQSGARWNTCFGFLGGPVWTPTALSRFPLWSWSLSNTPSLEDAKKALLEGDRSPLCDAAQTTTYRTIGIGHTADAWSILIAPLPQDDPQKP